MRSGTILTATVAGAAAVFTAFALGFASSSTTVTAETTVQSDHAFPETVCVFGWSKDTCDGFLTGDDEAYECRRIVKDEHVGCRTHHLRHAELRLPVRRGNGTCGLFAEQLCDETPQLDGTILISGQFVFGRGNCRFRGAWEGDWRLFNTDGDAVAFGTGSGTLGTGSHRAISCIGPVVGQCNPDCERCHDVQFSDNGWWLVGLEGALRGEVFAGEWADSSISITLSGTLSTPGDEDGGPFSFAEWRFCGASDGVVLARCEG